MGRCRTWVCWLVMIVVQVGIARGEDLRVMSFNVRVGTADKGTPNAWENRKDLVVRTIAAFDPDLLGVQEAHRFQGDYLTDQLKQYRLIGVGSNQDGGGALSAILYREKRFDLVRQGQFWLSLTPDMRGSMGWDARFPRVVTWVELRDKQTPGLSFVYMNTHWDHVGDQARRHSAQLMRQKIKEIAGDRPVILTGDFNTPPGSPAYERLVDKDLVDSYLAVHRKESGGTSHPFNGKAGPRRIDWILHTRGFKTIEADIVRTAYDGRYPSDHFPVTAVVRRTGP